eukprot:3955043-Amphidinium_carterae.1
MSSPRHRASGQSPTCLAAALVFMIGVVLAAASTLYNSLEPLAAPSVPLPLGTEAHIVAVDIPTKSVHSGHIPVPSLVSVSEKTFEDFQFVHPHCAIIGERWLAADDQGYMAGLLPINEYALYAEVEPPWQDMNLMDCDSRETFTKVSADSTFQCSVGADVLNDTLVNHSTQLIPVQVGLELLNGFISDLPVDMDHVADLKSGASASPLAFNPVLVSAQLTDLVPCVDGDDLLDGLLVPVDNQATHRDTWIDTMLCWLASSCILQDFLLLSTWATQVWIWLANAKGIAWKAAAGFAQIFLVTPKWQFGRHPNSRRTQ